MAKAQDMTAVLKDMMGAFPVDTSALDDAFKSGAALNEKLAGVALEAAEKSSEISSKWTKDTLTKLNEISKAKAEPADYAKAMTDFASAQAEVAAENMAAFAEVAKKVLKGIWLKEEFGKELSDFERDIADSLNKHYRDDLINRTSDSLNSNSPVFPKM